MTNVDGVSSPECVALAGADEDRDVTAEDVCDVPMQVVLVYQEADLALLCLTPR